MPASAACRLAGSVDRPWASHSSRMPGSAASWQAVSLLILRGIAQQPFDSLTTLIAAVMAAVCACVPAPRPPCHAFQTALLPSTGTRYQSARHMSMCDGTPPRARTRNRSAIAALPAVVEPGEQLVAAAAEAVQGVGQLDRLGVGQVLAGPAADGPVQRRAAGDGLRDGEFLLPVRGGEPEPGQHRVEPGELAGGDRAGPVLGLCFLFFAFI